MVDRDRMRRFGPKRTRMLQRGLHLATGAVVLAYIYATPDSSSAVTAGMRWLVMPAVVLSGLIMWQWPRVRRFANARRPHA